MTTQLGVLDRIGKKSTRLKKFLADLNRVVHIPVKVPRLMFPILMYDEISKLDVTNDSSKFWIKSFAGSMPYPNEYNRFLDKLFLSFYLQELRKDFIFEMNELAKVYYALFIKHYNKNFIEIQPQVPAKLIEISNLAKSAEASFNNLEKLLTNKLFKFQAIVLPAANNPSNLRFEPSIEFNIDLELNNFIQ
jgi:hypothetical protein